METVLYTVDIRKVTVIDLLHCLVGELNGCRGRSARTRNTKESIERVGAALDLLNPAILDDAEVEHATVSRAHLQVAANEQEEGTREAERSVPVPRLQWDVRHP